MKRIKIIEQILKGLALGLIGVYRYVLSPLKKLFFGPNAGCRFYPCCSEYGRESVCRHGVLKGGLLTMGRILRCHPLHPGGNDPVPEEFLVRRVLRAASAKES